MKLHAHAQLINRESDLTHFYGTALCSWLSSYDHHILLQKEYLVHTGFLVIRSVIIDFFLYNLMVMYDTLSNQRRYIP